MMNDNSQMTNEIAAGKSAGSFRTLPFSSFGIQNSAFDIPQLHHLAPNGSMALLLANGSMSSNSSGDGDIRRALIEADLVECMVALPGQLLTNANSSILHSNLSRDNVRTIAQSRSRYEFN